MTAANITAMYVLSTSDIDPFSKLRGRDATSVVTAYAAICLDDIQNMHPFCTNPHTGSLVSQPRLKRIPK
jgi:hypothetical protein